MSLDVCINCSIHLCCVITDCRAQGSGSGLLLVRMFIRTDTSPAVFVIVAILRKGRSPNVAVNLSAVVGTIPVSHGSYCKPGKCY